MKSPQNPPDNFPNLRLNILEVYAKRWVQQYPKVPIERILLYRYSPLPLRATKATKGVLVRYCIVLKLSMEAKITDDAFLPEEELAHEYYHPGGDEYPFSEFIDAGFSDVYQRLPEGNYKEEWIIIFETPDEQLSTTHEEIPRSSIRKGEPHWILFEGELTSQERTRRIKELIEKIRPEMESLYAAVKKVGFSVRAGHVTEEHWQNAALAYFDRHQDDFQFIKREYLEDKELYFFSGGKERRDFIGRVLSKIILDRALESLGSRRLYEIYRTTDQPTISPTNLQAE